MVIIETLIEAQIIRVLLDKARTTAEVELLSADRQKHWCLVANGVDEFLMDELNLYNIVDDIFVYGADDVNDSDFVAQLYYLLRRKEISKNDTSWPFLQEKIMLVRNNDLKFWVIHPVYGGLVFILAKEISIIEM